MANNKKTGAGQNVTEDDLVDVAAPEKTDQDKMKRDVLAAVQHFHADKVLAITINFDELSNAAAVLSGDALIALRYDLQEGANEFISDQLGEVLEVMGSVSVLPCHSELAGLLAKVNRAVDGYVKGYIEGYVRGYINGFVAGSMSAANAQAAPGPIEIDNESPTKDGDTEDEGSN